MTTQRESIDKYGRTDLSKGDLVTIRGEQGIFEVVGISTKSKVRFLNRETGKRYLMVVEYVSTWVSRHNDKGLATQPAPQMPEKHK